MRTARPLKRRKHATSLQDDADTEADKSLADDRISTISNDISETIEVSSGGEDGDKLEKELGTTRCFV